MKVKSIRIIFEKEETDNSDHATEIVFSEGMWKSNGPCYSRLTEMMHKIWQLVRATV
jgi:hypothetical protein